MPYNFIPHDEPFFDDNERWVALTDNYALSPLEREEDLGALNDLSEDVRQDIENLYLAIADIATKLEEKKKEPRPRIGFKQ